MLLDGHHTPEWRVKQKREHREKYEAMAQRIGIAKLVEAVPFSADSVRRALDSGDEHLNTLPLAKWDAAVGHFHFGNQRQKELMQCCPTCGHKAPKPKKLSDREFVRHKPFEHGPHSIAERVCLLKHVARYHLVKGD